MLFRLLWLPGKVDLLNPWINLGGLSPSWIPMTYKPFREPWLKHDWNSLSDGAKNRTWSVILHFTGYHNVLLVDGIRLNHSAMRSGPNQYWSTVELFGSDQIEVLRGTHGTIYGSDAAGGVVNLLSKSLFL